MANVTTGHSNQGFGHNAGFNITTGFSNLCLGENAGDTITTGNYCVIVTNDGDVSAGGAERQIVIGETTCGGNNQFKVRASGGCFNTENNSSWNTTSDRRIKKNIVDNTTGLDKINQLRVRNFEYRTPDEIDYTEFVEGTNPKAIPVDRKGIQLGVIAQEIVEVLPDVVETSSTGVKTVNSDNLTWYLVNAVKELSSENNALKARLDAAGL